MPKEHKKRGRREEKRKREGNADDTPSTKKLKRDGLDFEEDENITHNNDVVYQEDRSSFQAPGEIPFYGLLDEEEQEYFRRADEMLELNQFGDAEERSLFLANVYKEANGKELKIANSQSCSRLMERLIIMSTPEQLKTLFGKFSGQYVITKPRFHLIADLAI